MPPRLDVLICYRGRYRPQVERLARTLRDRGLLVSYDREILADSGPPDAAEVEWIDLATDEKDEDVTWRAPLKRAVEAADLVAFLVGPVDQTSNTQNELAWVARAGRHALVIFDTGSESLSEEAQGIFVSMLNATAATALGTFEVPDYDYVFLAHQDPNGLDARLDVVANRVQECLERVRHSPPRTLRMDHGVQHVSELAGLPLSRARRRRTEIQDRWCRAFGMPEPALDRDVHQEVLELAYRYEKGATFEGDFIRPPGSASRYPRASEQRRFLRTNQIIERVRPGPREVPTLLVDLARHGASLELALESAVDPSHGFSPLVLVGTLPLTAVEDVSYVAAGPDYTVIWVDRAFADFVYQICKATVLSWKLLSDPDATPSRFSSASDDVAETLAADGSIEQGFFHCVSTYLQGGAPGASSKGAPRLAYQMALSPLVGMAYRFMLARGYAWLALANPEFPAQLVARMPAPANVGQAVLQHDYLSAVHVLASAAQVDRLPPALAMQGCGMPFVCADLIERALRAARPDVLPAAAEGVPSFRERLSALEHAFREFLKTMGREEAAQNELVPAHHAWRTVDRLWQQVEPLMRVERQRGLEVASVWRDPRVRQDLAALLSASEIADRARP